MQCSACGQDNPVDARTCAFCGQSLQQGPRLDKGAPEVNNPTVPYSDAYQAPTPVQAYQPGFSPVSPPPPPAGAGAQNAPAVFGKDFFVWSIVVTIVSAISCNILGVGLGIPAIIFSSQARDKLNRGDLYGAISDQKTGKIFFWIAFGFCAFFVLLWLFYLLVVVIAVIAGAQ